MPRNFALDPTYLFAVNESSNNLALFRVNISAWTRF